jgi:hypothetical protein
LTLREGSEFPLRNGRANKLDWTDRKFNLDNLHSKPKFCVSSKAFSISSNTRAIDIFLLKFQVTWSISLIQGIVML